jgi:hypothetical protein
MLNLNARYLNAWLLTGGIVVILLFLSSFAALGAAAPISGVRQVIRLTARSSLVLFLMAFTASSLIGQTRSDITEWLARNRRYIGVSFAASHVIHGAAIIWLAQTDYVLFLQITNIVTFISGGLAYVLIALMVMTSFDYTANLVGRRIWMAIHTTGAWYIFLSFTFSFGKRAVVNANYWPAMVLLFAGLAIRLLAARRRLQLFNRDRMKQS